MRPHRLRSGGFVYTGRECASARSFRDNLSSLDDPQDRNGLSHKLVLSPRWRQNTAPWEWTVLGGGAGPLCSSTAMAYRPPGDVTCLQPSSVCAATAPIALTAAATAVNLGAALFIAVATNVDAVFAAVVPAVALTTLAIATATIAFVRIATFTAAAAPATPFIVAIAFAAATIAIALVAINAVFIATITLIPAASAAFCPPAPLVATADAAITATAAAILAAVATTASFIVPTDVATAITTAFTFHASVL